MEKRTEEKAEILYDKQEDESEKLAGAYGFPKIARNLQIISESAIYTKDGRIYQ